MTTSLNINGNGATAEKSGKHKAVKYILAAGVGAMLAAGITSTYDRDPLNLARNSTGGAIAGVVALKILRRGE